MYWYHNIDGRWLAWGQILMQQQTISRNPGVQHVGAVNVSDPDEWVTTGTYTILKIYDPVYQEEFTRNDLPVSPSHTLTVAFGPSRNASWRTPRCSRKRWRAALSMRWRA